MFGKKTPPKAEPARAAAPASSTAPPLSGGGDDAGSRAGEAVLPWRGQPDEIGCNFALGHLVSNLPNMLKIQGRIQAETLMAATGAVAGMCAQVSLISNPEALRAAEAKQQLVKATLKDGRSLLYGDALNHMLYANEPALAPSRVWNVLVFSALSSGMPKSDTPSFEAMFKHVSATVGGEREGWPSTPPEHQPLMPARELLRQVGDTAFDCLTGDISELTRSKGFRAAETSWVAVSAQAAGSLLIKASEVLAPQLCIMIAMESAIYASKLMGNSLGQTGGRA